MIVGSATFVGSASLAGGTNRGFTGDHRAARYLHEAASFGGAEERLASPITMLANLH